MNGIEGFQQKEMMIFLCLLNTHIKVNINSDTKSLNFLKKAFIYTMEFFTTETHIKRILNYRMAS